MAKAVVSATSDFNELVTGLMELAKDFDGVVEEAATAQMEVLESAIKSNWVSMVPWGKAGDYVYDSIGYNVEKGNGNDVVGMAGVFLIDRVSAEHDKHEQYMITRGENKGAYRSHIKAPQLAYWAEFGYTPNKGRTVAGYPFLANAFYMSVGQQDYIFATVLGAAIDKRLNK